MRVARLLLVCVFAWLVSSCKPSAREEVRLLNVSYDPTRELYAEFNAAFAKHWQEKEHQPVSVQQSHGGSGKQARAVIEGLEADVVTLALEYDVSAISKKGLTDANWKARLPSGSAPYTSIIVLLVRKGNPKSIRDFSDLARDGIEVVTPNPKTGGGARLNYLATWAHGLRAFGGDEAKTRAFVGRVYHNVQVLDSGARGSTTTFVERGIGDVLITWENEAHMAIATFPAQELELVIPARTVLAEPTVSVVDRYAEKHRTREVAQAYLEYLYSDVGQEIIAKHSFRPRSATVLSRHRATFPNVENVGVDELGGWEALQKKHFSDGGIFDQLYEKR